MPPPIQSRESPESRSARLWPDPFFAPDVPSSEWLGRWLMGKGDADLAAQLHASPNCRRAMEAFRRENVMRAIKGSLDEGASGTRADEKIVPDSAERSPGALVTTSGTVRLFDADRGQPLWRLSRPPSAFLVEGPLEMRYDKIWRAILAVPEFTVPEDWLGSDELVLRVEGVRWLAFPKLEYPLSEAQIENVSGKLTERGLETLLLARAALAEGLPLPPTLAAGTADPSTPGRSDYLERRLEEASWLAAEADARRTAAEWEAEVEDALKQNPNEGYFEIRSLEAQPAFAGGAEVLTPTFVLTIKEGETSQDVLSRHSRLEQAAKPIFATLKQRPTDLGTGRLSALWKLNQPLPGDAVSPLVAIVDSLDKRVLGRAQVDTEGVVRWDAPLGAMGGVPVERLALIIFLPA